MYALVCIQLLSPSVFICKISPCFIAIMISIVWTVLKLFIHSTVNEYLCCFNGLAFNYSTVYEYLVMLLSTKIYQILLRVKMEDHRLWISSALIDGDKQF